jgi:hypothetical protein
MYEHLPALSNGIGTSSSAAQPKSSYSTTWIAASSADDAPPSMPMSFAQ